MKKFLEKLINKENLSFEESKDAFEILMNGKANYHQRNIVYVGKKIPKSHSREFIGTVKIKELTNVHAVV